MSKKDIGARVRQVREEAGLNQRDFATRLNVSNGSISQVESGGDFLLRMYQEFGTDITWLLIGLSDGGGLPAPTLPPDEAALLDNYRHSPKEQQDILKATSAAFAQSSRRRHGRS